MLDTLKDANVLESTVGMIANSDTHPRLSSIITNHPEMYKLFRMVERVAATNSTVLILGESGTGKELIARALHDMSGVKGHFVPINCGAIPDNLLESELFGYEKGAFTGAVNSKPGRFVLADGGTIFLDEIGEMSPHLQVKLLRVLQEKVVEAVGGVKARNVNVRVIAATNRDLQEQVREGSFREDLYYRLQVVPLQLPSLRARISDLPALIKHFSKAGAASCGRRPLVFSDSAIELLMQHSWPGNIRELENLVERLSVLVDSDAVYPADLPEHFRTGSSTDFSTFAFSDLPESGLDFNSIVEAFENRLIVQALERTGGNRKAAAELLNLNRTTLVEKIKKKGLDSIGKDSD